MKNNFYPEFIRNLPKASLPMERVIGYLFQGISGQICFFDFEADIKVPTHSHGNQWGVVLEGEISLTIGDETKLFRKGDSYFIPAGVEHSAEIKQECKAMDIFEDSNRYNPKSE